MDKIIKKLAFESKKSERSISLLFEDISGNLIREGLERCDPRFLQYLIRRARKRLKIQESPVYKTFKNFFKEN
jgi:hypothetical protein